MENEIVAERLLDNIVRCDICGDTRHSTTLHILSIEIDKSINNVKKLDPKHRKELFRGTNYRMKV